MIFMENKELVLAPVNPEILSEVVPGNVYYYDITTSTNQEAKLCKNVPDKSVFIAEEQTSGRGRLGRDWVSQRGYGIWMSIYLEPEISAEKISQLTIIAGISVSRAIFGSLIKWPNDVLLDGKKVSGILTEMVSDGKNSNKVIVGIGVNVNTEMFPEELSDKATSLFLHTGNFYDRTELAKNIVAEFFDLYEEFLKDGFSAIKDEYTKKCATLGREVFIISQNEEKIAKAVDISGDGELIIETDAGREIVNSGEVSVRGLLGYN